MQSSITVSSPATIANLGPGYDIIGMALENPRDILEVRIAEGGKDSIDVTGVGSATVSSGRNASAVAGRAVLTAAGAEGYSLRMSLKKGVPPRMGMGSSGASSAAGAFAVNELLGRPLGDMDLLRCAMEGERAACGSAHADNVAPALFGGVTVLLGYEPLSLYRLDPLELEVAVVSPELELGDEKTRAAREVLPPSVPLATVVGQMGSFASLVIGILRKDAELIGRGVSGDAIVEPARSKLIPGFYDVKRAAISSGAYGCSISGAGPSMFALCPAGRGEVVAEAMVSKFADSGIISKSIVVACGREGTIVV